MCDKLGISAWEVIEAAATKPFALPRRTTRAPGLGGDCIPVVPHFLAWRLREYGYSAQLIEAAHEVNARMPIYVRAEGRRRAQRRRPADQGLADPAARRGLQGRRPRHARVAEPRGHAPAARARRRRLATATRGCPELELDGVLHSSVEWSPERMAEAPTASSCLPHTGEFLEQPLWDQARLIVDTRNVVPRRRQRQARSDGPLLVLGAGLHRREAGGARARRRTRRSCSPTTGTRPSASSWRGSSARRARRDRRHPPAAQHLEKLLAERPRNASSSSPRRPAGRSPSASPTTPRRRTSPARGTWPRRSPRSGAPLVYGSSLHVYGDDLAGEIGPEHPYGVQRDLAHLSKIYAELCLQLYARRAGFALVAAPARDRLRAEPGRARRALSSQTVVDKFRRLAAAGEELPLDDGGRATIGVVHVEDAARILLESPRSALEVENVVAETMTVADVAALAARRADGRRSPACDVLVALRVPAPRSRSTCEAPRHRRDRLPRLADGDAAARAGPRGGASWRRARCDAGSSSTGSSRSADRGLRRGPALRGRARPGERARRPGARRARERRHDAQPARGLRRARRRARLPLDRPRRSRAAAGRVRALQAPRRDRLPPPPRPGRPSCASRRCSARARSWKGATGAIAAFAAKALAGEPIVIPGDPERTRDFVYVDDVVAALERIVADGRWNETLTVASGVATPLLRGGELVRGGRQLGRRSRRPEGSFRRARTRATAADAPLDFSVRPLEEAIPAYVDWLAAIPLLKAAPER